MNTKIKLEGFIADLAFKYVFSKKELFIDLINSYFEVKGLDKKVIDVVVTAQSLILPNKKEYKIYYGDILGLLDTGEFVSIEMNSRFGSREYRKNASYLFRLYSEQLKPKGDYYYAKKVFGLSFMTGNYHRDNTEIINEYGFNKKRTIETIYEDECISMDLIRLDLCNVGLYNLSDKRFFKWLKLISARSIEEMKSIANGDENMELALEYLRKFVNDPEILELYDDANVMQLNAYDDGVELGTQQGIINTAKNMLKDGLSIKAIKKYTGLTKEQIEDLK